MEEITKIRNQIRRLEEKLKNLIDFGDGWNLCKICGKRWKQRKEQKPKRCPKCFSENWENGIKKRASYDFASMEIGQSRIIPWSILPNGKMNNMKNYRVVKAIDSYSARTKRTFSKKPDYTGLKITRLT